MRELYSQTYNSDIYTDENVLYRNELIDTVSLSKGLTYLYGKDTALFPLLTLTEGQGGITGLKPKALNDTQYTWNVMGRQRNTFTVKALANTNNTKPGLGFTSFEVDCTDDWAKRYYSATTPDKEHQIRVQGTGVPQATGLVRYRFVLNTSDPTDYISLANFQDGQVWVLGATSVPASKSDGTSSNSIAPGKWTNQFGFQRYSKNIAGNVANKVTNVEFDLEGGGKTNLWMPFEMKQFEIHKRQMMEEQLWNGIYNRDSNGVIHLRDDETGEPIPQGAGIKEILKTTGQYETYATMTLNKWDSIARTLFTNRVDYTPMELVVYGGSGAMDQINTAIKSDAVGNSYYEKLGAEEIMSGKDGYLSYGKYFNQYKTIDGHIITFKYSKLFDQGSLAEMDRANGRVYDNLPYESYNMVLLDQSMNDDGERNIQLVGEKGREVITGVYKGMSPLPGAWGAIADNKILSTKKDEASYEIMTSQGITMKNYTTSYYLEFSR